MTDEELKSLVASLAVSQAKTDAQLAKTDKKIDQLAKMIGTFGRNLGEITEEFFFNSLKATQTLAGIHYDIVYKNMTASVNKIQDEFDIVMVNGKDVAVIEVKYKAHLADLEKLLNKKYTNFKKLFPMYKDYNHHLVLASFSLHDDLIQEALAQGVTVLQRKGDVIETFEPKAA